MAENIAPVTGMYFEDFTIGLTITTPARTIGEADVLAFADLTGDHTPIHTDAEFAARHPFGQRVAHGLLGLSVANALAVQSGFVQETILAFRGMSDWKFSLPIFFGDTIHACVTVEETRPVPRLGGGMVTVRVEILNQDGKLVQQGKWSMLVRSKTTKI
jgi:acyl dehydratase